MPVAALTVPALTFVVTLILAALTRAAVNVPVTRALPVLKSVAPHAETYPLSPKINLILAELALTVSAWNPLTTVQELNVAALALTVLVFILVVTLIFAALTRDAFNVLKLPILADSALTSICWKVPLLAERALTSICWKFPVFADTRLELIVTKY